MSGQPGGPGPPQRQPTHAAVWWIAVAAVLVVAAGAAVALIRSAHAPVGVTVTATATATSAVGASTAQCGSPGPGSPAPVSDRVVSGPVSFPVSAAPGWTVQDYVGFPQSSRTQGLRQSIAGQQWQAHAEVGLTNFASRLSTAEAARRIIPCLASGSRYAGYRPRVEGQAEPEAIVVDGVPAARVTARLLVSHPDLTLAGDDVTIVVIDSAPQAYFMSDTPIGDGALAAVAQQIFEQLKVARDV